MLILSSVVDRVFQKRITLSASYETF